MSDFVGDDKAERGCEPHVNESSTIVFALGEELFPLTMDIINERPNSYFANVIKPPWNNAEHGPIKVGRDIELFREVYTFMTEGHCITLHVDVPLQRMMALKREADFFGIFDLVSRCEQHVFPILQTWCTKKLPFLGIVEDINERNSCSVGTVVGAHLYPGSLKGKTIIRSSHLSISKIPGQVYETSTMTAILPNFSAFPRINSHFYQPSEKLIPRGQHLLTFSNDINWGNIGTVYCILHAADAGGEVYVMHNGVERKISKTGEYIVVLAGHTLNVSQVTFGSLILMLATLKMDLVDKDVEGPAQLPDTLYPELLFALLQEVPNYSGVALSLTKYYPISDFADEYLCAEGDPAVLEAVDASLYAYIAEHFTVTIVTVYIERQNGDCKAGVLHSSFVGKYTKFVVPPVGYGKVLDWSCRSDFRTLVTALYIQLKDDV